MRLPIYISGNVSISDAGKILDMLEDKGFDVDQETLDFDNALYFDCYVHKECFEDWDYLSRFEKDVRKEYEGFNIDWVAMSEWECYEE